MIIYIKEEVEMMKCKGRCIRGHFSPFQLEIVKYFKERFIKGLLT